MTPNQWAESGITSEDALLRMAFDCYDGDIDSGICEYLRKLAGEGFTVAHDAVMCVSQMLRSILVV